MWKSDGGGLRLTPPVAFSSLGFGFCWEWWFCGLHTTGPGVSRRERGTRCGCLGAHGVCLGYRVFA